MAGNTRELVRLEKLPTEIIHAIANLLRPWEIKQFSCASERLRKACLPTIFRHVKFDFSLDGIKRLKDLLTSDVRNHVTSFTYEITELLNTELLDFSYFRSEILTPDGYVDMAKEMYDYAEDFPSYMYIYETVCDICKQQCSIIDEGADLLLSSVFCALPLLKEVSLYFCETLAFDHGPLNRDARKAGLDIYRIYRIECQDMAFESNATSEDSNRIERALSRFASNRTWLTQIRIEYGSCAVDSIRTECALCRFDVYRMPRLDRTRFEFDRIYD